MSQKEMSEEAMSTTESRLAALEARIEHLESRSGGRTGDAAPTKADASPLESGRNAASPASPVPPHPDLCECGHMRAMHFDEDGDHNGPCLYEYATSQGQRMCPCNMFHGERRAPCSAVPAAPSPTWTAEQREAADRVHEEFSVAQCDADLADDAFLNALCAAIARVAHLFAPAKPAPSVAECERAFADAFTDEWSKTASGGYVSTKYKRAGIAAVRALCIGEQGDGASVPGDSGPKAGHIMERGSGCPASDDHADRETSTPKGPKDPAPSPTPAPLVAERDALRKERDELKHAFDIACRASDAKGDEIDALRKERGALRRERDTIADALRPVVGSPQVERSLVGAVEAALKDRRELSDQCALSRDVLGISAASSDSLSAHVRKLREDRDALSKERDELRARLDAGNPSRTAKRVTVSTEYLENEVRGALRQHIPLVWSPDAEMKLAEVAVATVLRICAPQTAKRVLTRDEFDRFSLAYREATGTHDGGMRLALETIGIDVEGA